MKSALNLVCYLTAISAVAGMNIEKTSSKDAQDMTTELTPEVSYDYVSAEPKSEVSYDHEWTNYEGSTSKAGNAKEEVKEYQEAITMKDGDVSIKVLPKHFKHGNRCYVQEEPCRFESLHCD